MKTGIMEPMNRGTEGRKKNVAQFSKDGNRLRCLHLSDLDLGCYALL